jgi:hypothetical protein
MPSNTREYQRKWRAENPEKVSKHRIKWRAENPEKIKETNRKYRVENPAKVKEANRKWKVKNPAKVKEWQRKWKAKNPEKVTEYRRKWRAENPEKVSEQRKKDLKTYHKKNRNNPIYRLHQNMRSAISAVLAGRGKSAPTMKIIGCTVEELFEHFESCSTWEPWMTRENYGRGGWDVDHIIAITKWDQNCPVQFAKCWHKSNLQPMEHIENIKKGAK